MECEIHRLWSNSVGNETGYESHWQSTQRPGDSKENDVAVGSRIYSFEIEYEKAGNHANADVGKGYDQQQSEKWFVLSPFFQAIEKRAALRLKFSLGLR